MRRLALALPTLVVALASVAYWHQRNKKSCRLRPRPFDGHPRTANTRPHHRPRTAAVAAAAAAMNRTISPNSKFIAKTVIVGEPGVGKTSLLRCFRDGTLADPATAPAPDARAVPTLAFQDKQVQVDGYAVHLQIWDNNNNTGGTRAASWSWSSPGGRRTPVKALPSIYYRGADAVVIVFAVDSRRSFDCVRALFNQAKFHGPDTVRMVLVANKCDVAPGARQVSTEEGRALATALAVPYFEASARTGECAALPFLAQAARVLHAKLSCLRHSSGAGHAQLVVNTRPQIKKCKRRSCWW